VEQARWLDRARRLGPLQYSALGARVLEPPSGELAQWVADFLDRRWVEEGEPDPFTAVVVSGDDGILAREILGLGPLCLSALRYVMVNLGGLATFEGAARFLPLEEPAFLFPSGPPSGGGPGDFDTDADDRLPPAAGIGPLVTYLSEMPMLSIPEWSVAIVAIECLSRLASDRLEWRDGQWLEIRMAAAASGNSLVEVAVPLARDRGPRPVPGGSPPPVSVSGGARFAVLTGAVAWLQSALRTAPAGTLAVVDRWTQATEPLEAGPTPPPLALDQLRRVRDPIGGRDACPEPLAAPGPADLSVVYWRIG
jgi:hypothetical protein